MTRWTKAGAITRMERNVLLQEAKRLEPRLVPIIEEARAQRNVEGYNRIREYVDLKA